MPLNSSSRWHAIMILTMVTIISCFVSCYVPVFVMMPLNTINNDGSLNNANGLMNNLQRVKNVGTDGIMIDVWWGIVEGQQPQKYNFTGYRQLFAMCKQIGLKVQAVMSFHQCGTNVGDACYITLPSWVLKIGQSNPDIFYTDQNSHRDKEYLSLGVDLVSIFPTSVAGKNRTAADIYSDFMSAFKTEFTDMINNGVIALVEVGLGPAGEMRYPSYQLQNNLWTFPGIGAFQCYDKYMLNNLSSAAKAAGNPDWGFAGPDNAGYYNSYPSQTGFFSDSGGDNYSSSYGRFFLNWYSSMLINHGAIILARAQSIFKPSSGGVPIAAKIAGIHWWYLSSSHAAEATAGYYNTDGNNGYSEIASMLSKYNAGFDFTCLEMFDSSNGNCGPQELVQQTKSSAFSFGVSYGGENALPIDGNTAASQQIIKQASSNGQVISSFTYLRMSDTLFNSYNLNIYTQLVNSLHGIGSSNKEHSAEEMAHIDRLILSLKQSLEKESKINVH